MTTASPRTRFLAASLVLVLALFAALALGSRADAGGATISAQVSKKTIRWQKSTQISGQLDNAAPTDAGRPVELWARRFPYNQSRLVDTTTTDVNGDYAFTASPALNTRYWVTLADEPSVSSVTRRVYVLPLGGLRLEVRQRRGIVLPTLKLRYSTKLTLRLHRRKLFFYFRKTGQDRFRTVDTGRTRKPGPGRLLGKGRFRIPTNKRYRFVVVSCFDVPRRDFGLGRPVDSKRCPRDGFPARRGKAAAASAGAQLGAPGSTRG